MIHCALLTGAPQDNGLSQAAPGGPSPTLLSPLEQKLLGARAMPKRRDDFYRGRWIGKHLLSEHFGAPAEQFIILPDEHGVPWAYDASLQRLPVLLSLSHTAGYACAAFASEPLRIGIDIESLVASPETLLQDYFTPDEVSLCTEEPEQLALRVSQLWSIKESMLKALGQGLRLPTQSVCVLAVGSPSDSGWQPLTLQTRAPLDDTLRFCGWVKDLPDAVLSLVLLIPPGCSCNEPPPVPRLYP